MAAEKYTINFVDPTKSTITVIPNSLSGPSGGIRTTDIDLLGMGHSLWGEMVLENFIHMLENFSCTEDIHTILAVPSASTFTVQGDVTPAFTNGRTFNIWDSDNNDGVYTVSSSSYSSGTMQTTVVIVTTGSPTPTLVAGGNLGSAGELGIPNLALTYSPTLPLEGQIWYNQTRGQIHVYERIGSPAVGNWKRVGGITFSTTAPTSPSDGDLWWETTAYATTTAEYGRNLHIRVAGTWVRVVEDYMPRDGSKIMTGDLDLNNNQLNNVGTPAVGTDGMSRDYADARYVELAGDTMAGDLDMNNNQLNNVGTPAVGTDGMSRDYADARYASASAAWPIGSVYISIVSTNPNTLLGFGTWSQIAQGRTLVGQNGGDALFITPESTGGSKNAIVVSHTHTTNSAGSHTHGLGVNVVTTQTPYKSPIDPTSGAAPSGSLKNEVSAGSHTHTINSTGSSGTNANLPPYFVTYMWKRTA